MFYCHTVLYCTVLYGTVLYCTLLSCTVLYCTVLYCTVLYCGVLYCTVLYCTVLYCTVLCYPLWLQAALSRSLILMVATLKDGAADHQGFVGLVMNRPLPLSVGDVLGHDPASKAPP